MAQVDRIARTVKTLSETTEIRLKNLETAVGQLNELVADMRMPIGTLNPNRMNGSSQTRFPYGA